MQEEKTKQYRRTITFGCDYRDYVDIRDDDEVGGNIWNDFVECEESSICEHIRDLFEEYLKNEMDFLENNSEHMFGKYDDEKKLNHLLKKRWLANKIQNI